MTTEEAKQRLASRIQSLALDDDDLLALQTLIPELSESEDERIRKEIIDYLSNELHNVKQLTPRTNEFDAWIAYLEKQKEQKSLDISAASEWLKNHVCNYVNSEYNEFHKCVEYDGSIDKERLVSDFEEAMQKEQKPAEWDELQAEFKNINEAFEDGKKEVVDNPERYGLCRPAEWSKEDTCILEDAVTAVDLLGNDDEYSKTHPNLAKAFRVAKDWLKSLPERFNLQPKQEWNEEDKKRVVELKTFIAQCNGFNKANRQKAFEMIDALYPQPTQEWSEEDEKWFKEIELMALYFSNDTNYRERFFNWLKSVKGFKSLCPKPHTVSIKDAAKFGDLEYERGVKDGIQSEKSRHWKPGEEHIRVLLKANPVNLMPQELDVYNSLCKEIQKLM